MRETRVAQISIFENYAQHEFAERLLKISNIIDRWPEILTLIEKDLTDKPKKNVGRKGLTVENVLRCLFLKQTLQISYQQLAFHLADSMTYRSFARLADDFFPKKSALQATIRKITPETLEKIHILISQSLLNKNEISLEKIRIDSTVVKSNIAPPSDSQLLEDAVRVISRYLAKSHDTNHVKIRFTDKRKAAKSLAFRIFNAKNAEKETLYPELLKLVRIVLKQASRGLDKVFLEALNTPATQQWQADVKHYRDLMLKVINQTERRVIQKEKVPTAEKIVSIFEPHTDVIVKGYRDIQYGHKINLASDRSGFITYLRIETGNPADSERFLPVLKAHEKQFGRLPKAVACDGGYASKANVESGRNMGVKHVVFHKRVGISYQLMGVKKKTFISLRNFRAGIEGNISELKRAYGASKAMWKKESGFQAFVWSSVICYNLVRLSRMHPD